MPGYPTIAPSVRREVAAVDDAPDLLERRLERLAPAIDDAARAWGVAPVDLRLRFGLHLPRLWAEGGFGVPSAEVQELTRLAAQSRIAQAPFVQLAAPPLERPTIQTLFVSEMSAPEVEAVARPILTAFHYLRSFRRNSNHFALRTGAGKVAAVATVSPFDLGHVAPVLTAPPSEPLTLAVLSRVFVFRWAPHNSISKLLAEVVRWCRRRASRPGLLVSYVNPNLGLTGASYVASGWQLVCREVVDRVSYDGMNYITERELSARHSAAMASTSENADETSVRSITLPMQPLRLYARGWGMNTPTPGPPIPLVRMS